MNKKMIKKMLVLGLLLVVAGCGAKQVEYEPTKPESTMPSWRMMMHKEPGSSEIRHEDRWFEYTLALNSAAPAQNANKNTIYGQCRYGGGTYTVLDKDTAEVIRSERIPGDSCKSCHMR